jgi:hydrogenase maturation protease
MLIIGCGNLHRGDDAAGIIAAERLRARGIDAELCPGGFTQLIEMWDAADDVLVIDAVVTGSPAGTIHEWNGLHPIPPGKTSGSTHGLGIAEAVELSRTLNRLPRKLRIYGIEGNNFELGSQLSPEVESAVENLATLISGDLKRSR